MIQKRQISPSSHGTRHGVRHSARKIALIILIVAYCLMWAGGAGHYILKGGPPLDAPWTASLFLLLAGALVVVASQKRELIDLFAVASIGFAAEVVGIRSGLIFGPYRYTETLGPQLLGVPIVMLSAWMVLVSYTRQICRSVRLPGRLELLFAALWMTAMDMVIDPLAANQLGYWRWAETGAYYGVPLRNFAGWFLVSLLIFSLTGRESRLNYLARYVGLSIVLFFTVIAISYGLVIPGGIGLGLSIIHIYFHRSSGIKGRAELAPGP